MMWIKIEGRKVIPVKFTAFLFFEKFNWAGKVRRSGLAK